MIFSLIREAVDVISHRIDRLTEDLKKQCWYFVFSLGLVWVSISLILISLCLFGFALYQFLIQCLGPNYAPLVVSLFFLLSALVTLKASKNYLNK